MLELAQHPNRGLELLWVQWVLRVYLNSHHRIQARCQLIRNLWILVGFLPVVKMDHPLLKLEGEIV
jgi:hypothetical protein